MKLYAEHTMYCIHIRVALLLGAFLALMAASTVLAQGVKPVPTKGARLTNEFLPFSAGIIGGFGPNLYLGVVDLGANPQMGAGNCGVLENGFGLGATFGVFGEYKLTPGFTMGLRIMGDGLPAIMTAQSGQSEFRRGDGELVAVESEHQFDVDLSTLSFELYGAIQPFDSPFTLKFGPKIGIPYSSSYALRERLLTPEEATFENGTKEKPYATGQLNTAPLFGVLLGGGYPLTMGRQLDLIPELTLGASVNSITDFGNVISATTRASVSVRYLFRSPLPDLPVSPPESPRRPPLPVPQLPPLAPAIPPAPPQPIPLVASTEAYGLTPDGSTRPEVLLQEFRRTRTKEIALLPYVFFDENSSAIPKRYRAEDAAQQNKGTISGYRALLNELGERMAQNADAQITLIGTNSGTSAEQGNVNLSLARAESVKKYLTDTWGIAPKRIVVQARELPEYPSNNAYPGGREENRRVEIRAPDGLLEPLSVSDQVSTYASPGMRFRNEINADANFEKWEVAVALNGSLIRRLKGEQVLKNTIDEQFTESELQRMAQGNSAITYAMTATAEGNETVKTEEKTIPVKKEVIVIDDPLLDDASVRYENTVLFPYNSSTLQSEDRESLARLKEKIPAGATIVVTGYADETGGGEYNNKLSLERARAVAEEFNGFPVRVEAASTVKPIHPNDTPEGRFYSRTVAITIKQEKGSAITPGTR